MTWHMPSLMQVVDLQRPPQSGSGMGLKENKCTSLQNFILRKQLEWLVTSVSFKQIAETHFQQKKLDMMLQKTYEFSILLFSYCEDQFAFANMK